MPSLAELWSRTRNWLRFEWIEPIRYGTDVTRAALRGHTPRHRVLLVGDRAVYTSEQQFAPLLNRRAALAEQLGVVLQHQGLAHALSRPEAFWRPFDFVGLKLGFRTSPGDAERTVRAIRATLAPEAKLVYFDGDDDLGVQWPQLLPLFDLYVKKHCFRERSEYSRRRIGKSNLTDYVSRNFGISFADDIIPTSEAVPLDQIAKIVPGWNLAMDDKILRLHARRSLRPGGAAKDIAVVCRASAPRDSWIYPLRSMLIPEIRRLEPEHRVLTPEERVSQDVYYQEMLRSRICVSPFGYGEICWRDFEAILCGCVLVKPDMSHVETVPDIFVPDVTYVPVRWDYSDLGAKLRALLADPERCERLRARALEVLDRYIGGDGVIESFRRILNGAGLAGAHIKPAA